MLYEILKFTLTKLCKLFIKEVNGLENTPSNEGLIFAINHVSYLDTLFISVVIAEKFNKKLHNLGKAELFESYFGNLFHKTVGTIPIKRDSTGSVALNIAVEFLKKNGMIAIYPEGARSRDGNLKKGKTGVARLALSSKKKVIPVGIKGTYEIWPAHRKIPKFKKIAIINIGKPMDLSDYYDKEITKRLLREITDKIMNEIGKLTGQKYGY